MAFTSFQTILPDPNNGVGIAGNPSTTTADKGPGFASVNISSGTPIQVTRTNSGRLILLDEALDRGCSCISKSADCISHYFFTN